MTFPRPAEVLNKHVNGYIDRYSKPVISTKYLKTSSKSAKMSKKQTDDIANDITSRPEQNQNQA